MIEIPEAPDCAVAGPAAITLEENVDDIDGILGFLGQTKQQSSYLGSFSIETDIKLVVGVGCPVTAPFDGRGDRLGHGLECLFCYSI